MAGENVEIVRAGIEAFNRGDWDGALSAATPDFEIDMSRATGPIKGVYRIDQIRGVWDDLTDVWESSRIEPEEFIDAGEHVVVPWTFHAAGREGIEVQARTTWAFTVRDGAIERVSMYQEREEALEAVGLGS